jgi:NAD(P)-dependent dehydrogenase (short-subunit alcohol dehydrogenase family)
MQQPAGVLDSWKLAGRTALITGASSGLGRHLAVTLARAGARIVAAARRGDRVRALAEEIASLPGDGACREACGVELDVTDAGSVRRAFDTAAAVGFVPDIVVNCAGVTAFKPALEIVPQEWDAVMDTNLKGAWLVSQEAALRWVNARLAGSIINIASILGLRAGGGVSAYSASKAGLVHMTRALALEWARHGIRVNAIAPGYFATDLNREFLQSDNGEKLRLRIPQRRFGVAKQLDGPLLLLASDAGSYMTGSIVVVDGGHLCSSL